MFKHDKDHIYLNGLKISLCLFKRLEPSYQYPNDLVVMFYDGNRRHYRTKHKSWTVVGKWEDGNRYLARIDDFSRLLAETFNENQEVVAQVEAAKKELTPELDIKAKYPEEVPPNVELQQRTNFNKSGTKRVRTSRKRSPSS
jgi:hypothetical protein